MFSRLIILLVLLVSACAMPLKKSESMRKKKKATVLIVGLSAQKAADVISDYLSSCHSKIIKTVSSGQYGTSTTYGGKLDYNNLIGKDYYEIQLRRFGKKPFNITKGHIVSLVDVNAVSENKSKVSIYGYDGSSYLYSYWRKLLKGYKIVLGQEKGDPHCPNIK